ncbi:MAG: hypothetical protein ACQSGP_05080 [Frankia sp.]
MSVDTAELRAIGAGLRFLAAEFGRVSGVVHPGVAAVGHPALGQALHAFAANWRHHRARIVDEAGGLAGAATGAAQTYEQVDSDLAIQMRQSGPRPPGPWPPDQCPPGRRVADRRSPGPPSATRRAGAPATALTGRRR